MHNLLYRLLQEPKLSRDTSTVKVDVSGVSFKKINVAGKDLLAHISQANRTKPAQRQRPHTGAILKIYFSGNS